MNDLFFGLENWRKKYLSSSDKEQESIWIFVVLDNDQEIYINKYESWFNLKKHVEKNNLTLKYIGLKYRSNSIKEDVSSCDGVYLIKSVKGQLGGVSKQCFTIGKIKGNEVHKTMWLVPELIEEFSCIDPIEKCFEEAILHYEKTKTKLI